MMIADIGQATVEEIDIGVAGANYGWSMREGSWVVDHNDETRLSRSALDDIVNGLTDPAIEYGHHLGLAVTGGFVYRGKAIPALAGKYFFGDIASGPVFFTNVDQLANGKAAPFFELPLIYSGKQQSLREIMHAGSRRSQILQDELGEIYLLTKQDGVIRKLARSVETESTILPVDHPVGSLNK